MAFLLPLSALLSSWALAAPLDRSSLFVASETWSGRLLSSIPELRCIPDESQKLSNGRWALVLFRPDCSICRKLEVEIHRRQHLRIEPDSPKFVFVQVPPFDLTEPSSPVDQKRMRIADDRVFIETPTIVWLADGKVLRVSHELN